jgi:hypothetical protein
VLFERWIDADYVRRSMVNPDVKNFSAAPGFAEEAESKARRCGIGTADWSE